MYAGAAGRSVLDHRPRRPCECSTPRPWRDLGPLPGDLRRIVDNAWLESRAQRICSFDALVIPGLFQTREYMEEVMRAADAQSSDEQIRRWIEFRLIRQQVLAGSAPHLTVVLDEALLHRSVGGPEVMSRQLGRLLDASRQTNIEIVHRDALESNQSAELIAAVAKELG